MFTSVVVNDDPLKSLIAELADEPDLLTRMARLTQACDQILTDEFVGQVNNAMTRDRYRARRSEMGFLIRMSGVLS